MKIANIIENILRDKPETRSSDRQLMVAVWESLGFYLSESQKYKFYSMPSTETIRRVRQKLQENGQYRATDSVAKERHIKSLIVQQNEPIAKPERLETLMEQRSMFK